MLQSTGSQRVGQDFPSGSDGKESACNAGDLPGSRRSLGQEDLLEKEMATHSSILPLEVP